MEAVRFTLQERGKVWVTTSAGPVHVSCPHNPIRGMTMSNNDGMLPAHCVSTDDRRAKVDGLPSEEVESNFPTRLEQ